MFSAVMRERVLEPEKLDFLAHDDPDALQSRGDIRFLNSIMGSFRWVRNQLAKQVKPEDRIVELGAGDGGLLSYVAEKHPEMAQQWTGLDLAPRPPGLPKGAQWVQGDFFSATAAGEALNEATVVVANLILHHFTDEDLGKLAGQFKKARVLVINEPARYVQHYWKGRLLDAIFEFNHVTMYDMLLSIRAGFRKGELRQVLSLSGEEWECWESSTFTSACRLVAGRK